MKWLTIKWQSVGRSPSTKSRRGTQGMARPHLRASKDKDIERSHAYASYPRETIRRVPFSTKNLPTDLLDQCNNKRKDDSWAVLILIKLRILIRAWRRSKDNRPHHDQAHRGAPTAPPTLSTTTVAANRIKYVSWLWIGHTFYRTTYGIYGYGIPSYIRYVFVYDKEIDKRLWK